MAVPQQPRHAQGVGPRARTLRFLFGLLYRSRTLYWLASTIPFAGQWRTWQRLALTRLVGSDALEVGCGIGELLADMVQAGYTCTAIDRSPQMVAATRATLRRRGLTSGASSATVLEASIQRLPFPAESFDSVVSTFPTEYIADGDALREIVRVLRPGGRLVVVLGAALLPVRGALAPFVAFQTLVYGRGADSAPPSASCSLSPASALTTALRNAGLDAHAECVNGPFWLAYLLLADKPA